MTQVIADKTRAGLMGPNHVKKLTRLNALIDPTEVTTVEPALDLVLTDIKGAPFASNLARATVGGYRQRANGLLVPTAIYEPVIDHAAGVPLGTGFYSAYTNLLLRSEEFDNAAWTKAEATITANAVAAPDGTTTADKIVESSNNIDHSVRNATGVAPGVTTCTLSVFAKSAERSQIKLTLYEGSAIAAVGFDLSNGTILTGTGGKIEDYGNGWYRCSITAAIPTGAALLGFIMPMSGGVSTYLGNGTSGVYAWGAQLTATAFPVPYVPTTSAAVVRNTDSMVISGTDFTDFFNPLEGTIYVDAIAAPAGAPFPALFQIDDGGDNNRYILYQNAGVLSFYVNVASVNVAAPNLAVTPGDRIKVVCTYALNSFQIYVNGVAGTLDTAGGLVPGAVRMKIGWGNSAWNEHVSRMIYFPKTLIAAEALRMTR